MDCKPVIIYVIKAKYVEHFYYLKSSRSFGRNAGHGLMHGVVGEERKNRGKSARIDLCYGRVDVYCVNNHDIG